MNILAIMAMIAESNLCLVVALLRVHFCSSIPKFSCITTNAIKNACTKLKCKPYAPIIMSLHMV